MVIPDESSGILPGAKVDSRQKTEELLKIKEWGFLRNMLGLVLSAADSTRGRKPYNLKNRNSAKTTHEKEILFQHMVL